MPGEGRGLVPNSRRTSPARAALGHQPTVVTGSFPAARLVDAALEAITNRSPNGTPQRRAHTARRHSGRLRRGAWLETVLREPSQPSIHSIDAVVRRRLLTCCSVRWLRSRLLVKGYCHLWRCRRCSLAPCGTRAQSCRSCAEVRPAAGPSVKEIHHGVRHRVNRSASVVLQHLKFSFAIQCAGEHNLFVACASSRRAFSST